MIKCNTVGDEGKIIIINKGQANFNQIKFVMRARAPKHSKRPVFEKIFIIEGVAHATDGYRMHYANVDAMDNGIYDGLVDKNAQVVLSLCMGHDLSYPDRNSIICKNMEIEFGEEEVNFNKLIRLFYKALPYDSRMLDVDFIKDLFIDEKENWRFSLAGEEQPAYFYNDTNERFAIIQFMKATQD